MFGHFSIYHSLVYFYISSVFSIIFDIIWEYLSKKIKNIALIKFWEKILINFKLLRNDFKKFKQENYH